MANLGFNNAAFAPVAQNILDALFVQDPVLLSGADCLLQAGTYFRKSSLSEMIQDSVLVLLQDLIPLDGNNDPLPVPPGITGKATPTCCFLPAAFPHSLYPDHRKSCQPSYMVQHLFRTLALFSLPEYSFHLPSQSLTLMMQKCMSLPLSAWTI